MAKFVAPLKKEIKDADKVRHVHLSTFQQHFNKAAFASAVQVRIPPTALSICFGRCSQPPPGLHLSETFGQTSVCVCV